MFHPVSNWGSSGWESRNSLRIRGFVSCEDLSWYILTFRIRLYLPDTQLHSDDGRVDTAGLIKHETSRSVYQCRA